MPTCTPNSKKCEFLKPSVEYLGLLSTKEGIHMDPERVKTISEWPRPKTYRDIQVFLGFCTSIVDLFSIFLELLDRLLLTPGLKNGKNPALLILMSAGCPAECL